MSPAGPQTAELESGTHARFAPLRTRRSDVRRVCQGLGGAVSVAAHLFNIFFFLLVLKGVGAVVGAVHVQSQLKCGEKWERLRGGVGREGQTWANSLKEIK